MAFEKVEYVNCGRVATSAKFTVMKNSISLKGDVFKDTDFVDLLIDKEEKLMLIKKGTKEGGHKIIKMQKTTRRKISCKNAFVAIGYEHANAFIPKHSWSDEHDGWVVDLNK